VANSRPALGIDENLDIASARFCASQSISSCHPWIALSPVAKLFVERARAITKPLASGK
jgi:hypothetical protein